jgi:hypothetical protein
MGITLGMKAFETGDDLVQHLSHKEKSIAAGIHSLHPLFDALSAVCHQNLSNPLAYFITK